MYTNASLGVHSILYCHQWIPHLMALVSKIHPSSRASGWFFQTGLVWAPSWTGCTQISFPSLLPFPNDLNWNYQIVLCKYPFSHRMQISPSHKKCLSSLCFLFCLREINLSTVAKPIPKLSTGSQPLMPLGLKQEGYMSCQSTPRNNLVELPDLPEPSGNLSVPPFITQGLLLCYISWLL